MDRENESAVSEIESVGGSELEENLYARHVEVKSLNDLLPQRGTPIPALFNNFYKFIQNPSTVSIETYKRMIDTDDTVGSGVDFLTTCLAARLGRYQHPSQEITQWVNGALERVQGGFYNAVKELLGASWAGFAVQEKVWANDEHGFIVKKFVSLPPSSILFETERTGELTPDGILQYQRNYNPGSLSYGGNFLYGFAVGGRPDPYAKFGDYPFPIRTGNMYNYLSIRIPVEKCVHYAFNSSGQCGNPYGRSLLRRCYKWWVMKDAFMQMMSIALDRKGTPLTVIFCDPSAQIMDAEKFQAGVNHKGQRVGIRSDVAAAKAFANVHNDSTIFLPGKKGQMYDIEFVQQSSNANDFMGAIGLCDRSILRALLIPSLIFGNGDGTGSYSLGQEHANTFDKILDGMLEGVKQTYINSYIKQLLHYNFPEKKLKKEGYGSFSKRQLTRDEIQKEMQVFESAVNIGAIDMNDLNDLNSIREKIGFEARQDVIKKEDDDIREEGEDEDES